MRNKILKSSEVNRTEHLLRKLTQIIFVVVFSLSLLSGDRRDLWIAIPSGLLILFMIYQMVCIIRLEETSIQYINGKIKIKAFKNIYSPRLVTKTLQAEDVKSESLEEHLFIRSGYEHQTLKYILKSGEEISVCIDSLRYGHEIEEEALAKSKKKYIIKGILLIFLGIIAMIIPLHIHAPSRTCLFIYFFSVVVLWASLMVWGCDYPECLEEAGEGEKAIKILFYSYGAAHLLLFAIIIISYCTGWLELINRLLLRY